ncbi:hypothetical protein HYY75_02005 [bacterium]|nr:hypothetical protein [bacterium]
MPGKQICVKCAFTFPKETSRCPNCGEWARVSASQPAVKSREKIAKPRAAKIQSDKTREIIPNPKNYGRTKRINLYLSQQIGKVFPWVFLGIGLILFFHPFLESMHNPHPKWGRIPSSFFFFSGSLFFFYIRRNSEDFLFFNYTSGFMERHWVLRGRDFSWNEAKINDIECITVRADSLNHTSSWASIRGILILRTGKQFPVTKSFTEKELDSFQPYLEEVAGSLGCPLIITTHEKPFLVVYREMGRLKISHRSPTFWDNWGPVVLLLSVGGIIAILEKFF